MNLSLCCISNVLAEQGIKFQSMTYSHFVKMGKAKALPILAERILNNFRVTEQIIRHCVNSGIKGYRLSSSLTPVIDHPDINLSLEELPNWNDIEAQLKSVSLLIKETGIRISSHPSEYVSLSSDNPSVITNSVRDLESHGKLYDYLDLPLDYRSPINIHVRKDGDPEHISSEVLINLKKLSSGVMKRLVFENNDNKEGVWSVTNLYKYFHQIINIPITYDSLHRQFLNHGKSEQEDFELAYSTWGDFEPLFHYSESADGTRKHADMPKHKPNSFGKNVMWDCELKGKDLAILHILNS